jgi:predicted nucleic acid-binding protein
VRQLPEGDRRVFLHAAAAERLAGGRIYDAHIAEIARLGRASFVVTDTLRHFTGLAHHDIAVVSAAEFAERIGTS